MGLTSQTLTRLGIGLIVVLAVILGFVLFWPSSRLAANEPEERVSQLVIAQGRDIYEANCAGCHGQQGQGGGGGAIPALNGSAHSWHHSDDWIMNQIRQGGMRMPAVGADWSDEEVEAVLTYFKQWWTPQLRRSQAGTIGE